MDFRHFVLLQQQHAERQAHGPAADATIRSLSNYPGSSLREVLQMSGHPHNIEPILLTLRRPANAPMRARFAEVAGEIVLISKALQKESVVQV